MTENPQDQPDESGQQPYSQQPPPPPPPPPAYGQQAPVYGQPAPVSPSDARMWALLANLGGILFGFLAPLVVYLIYKDRDPFIRRHAAQALNFQIIAAIALFVSALLFIVIIGFFTMVAAGVCMIVFPILGSIAANKGEPYDYPLIPQMVT
jgi:uncharacterized protein